MSQLNLVIVISKVKSLILCLIAILVSLNLLGLYSRYYIGHDYIYGLVPMFNLDTEGNIPSFFSSLLLLGASLLLYVIARAAKKNNDVDYVYWFFLSMMFLYVAIDEAVSIHELFIEPLRNTFNLSGFLYFSWVVIGFFVVFCVSVFYFRFIFSLPKNIRDMFILSAFLYVGGALGVECIGGFYSENYGQMNFTYGLITTVEEMLEMFGLYIFVSTLLGYIFSCGYVLHVKCSE